MALEQRIKGDEVEEIIGDCRGPVILVPVSQGVGGGVAGSDTHHRLRSQLADAFHAQAVGQ